MNENREPAAPEVSEAQDEGQQGQVVGVATTENAQAEAPLLLFPAEEIRGGPPSKRRMALQHGDEMQLLREQVTDAYAFVEDVLNTSPISAWVLGRHTCRSFPRCEHAGCNALKAIQKRAKTLKGRWNQEWKSPQRALIDMERAEKELDAALDALAESRNAARRDR